MLGTGFRECILYTVDKIVCVCGLPLWHANHRAVERDHSLGWFGAQHLFESLSTVSSPHVCGDVV